MRQSRKPAARTVLRGINKKARQRIFLHSVPLRCKHNAAADAERRQAQKDETNEADLQGGREAFRTPDNRLFYECIYLGIDQRYLHGNFYRGDRIRGIRIKMSFL